MTFKIYTKTGDKGETALYGGTRVSKASARVEAYGTIDELNAFIGIAKSHIDDSDCLKQLAEIQYDLFTLGSEAATPIDKVYLANGKSRLPVTIKEEDISKLEVWMDKMDESLEPLQFLFYLVAVKLPHFFMPPEQSADGQNAEWCF